MWQGYVEGQAEEAKAAGEVTKSKQEVLKVFFFAVSHKLVQYVGYSTAYLRYHGSLFN